MKFPEINKIGDKVRNWQTDQTSYFRSLPLKNYIFSAIAVLGIIATCLPWADVTVGFYNNAMAVGLHFFIGWLVFLAYIAVFVIMLFNKYLKIEVTLAEKVPVYAAIVTFLMTFVFLIWKLFHVRYGVYLCLLVSSAFLFSVWYFYFKTKK